MKKIYTLTIVTVLLTACNSPKEITTTISENEELVQRYFEHFNNHEWTKMANMYIENAEFKGPSLGREVVKQSRQQIIDKYAALQSVFPNLRDQVIKTYPSGNNHIIITFVSSGTGQDNSKFELPICTIFTIENGMITQDFSYFDNFDESDK